MYGIIEPEENFPNITNENCALKECLTKEIYSKLFWIKTHSGYTIDDAIQIGIDCEEEEIGFYLGDYESIEAFEPLLGLLLDKIHPYFDYKDSSISHSGNLKMIKFDGTQTLKDFVIEYAFHLRRNLRGYSLPPHCTRAERREINRILIYILKQLKFDVELPHFHAYQSKIKSNSKSNTPKPKEDKKKKKQKKPMDNINENKNESKEQDYDETPHRISITVTPNDEDNKHEEYNNNMNENSEPIETPKLKQTKSETKKKKKKTDKKGNKKGKKKKKTPNKSENKTETITTNEINSEPNGHVMDESKDINEQNDNDVSDVMDTKEQNEINETESAVNSEQKQDNIEENKQQETQEITIENESKNENKNEISEEKENNKSKKNKKDQLDEPPKLQQSQSEPQKPPPKKNKKRDSNALKQRRRDSMRGRDSINSKKRTDSNSLKKRRSSDAIKTKRRDSNAMKPKRRDSNAVKKRRDSDAVSKKRRDSNASKNRRDSDVGKSKKRRDSDAMKKRDSKKGKKKKKKKKNDTTDISPTSITKLSKIKANESTEMKINLSKPSNGHVMQASTDTVVISPDDYSDTFHTADLSTNWNLNNLMKTEEFDESKVIDLVNIDDLTLTELEENGLAPSRELSLSNEYLIGGLSRDFPDSRTLFYNRKAMVGAWTNHENHLEMIIKHSKPDLNEIYKKFVDIYIQFRRILKRKEMAWIRHRRLGIITTSPKYFGTGLTIQCSIKAPYLSVHAKFKRILNKRSLEVISIGEDGIINLETMGTLGRSENQMTMDLGNALIDLWRMEKALGRNKDIEKLI